MGNLTNLVQFGITSNNLEGCGLPSWIANWSQVKYLWLAENNLGGTIPDLSDLNYLRILILKKNNLEGEIPQYLFDGTMPMINMVNLSFNKLRGTIPEFSPLNNLKALQLSGNNLTGPIPESIKNLPKMINLSLGWNALEGEIPDLSHMHHLRYLRVNDNNLTGSLPMVDTSNKELQFLHFQNNQLSGSIPVEFARLGNSPNFKDLNISDNNFSDADMQPLIEVLNRYNTPNHFLNINRQETVIDTTVSSELPAQ
jgi:Leucine-rich repeat (LRR) protein